MATIIEFLRTRLDEDEQVARKAGPPPWRFGDMQIRDAQGDLVVKHTWPQEAEHIARWDPARVLAEVDAKRWMLDTLVPEVEDMDETLHQEFCGRDRPDAHSYIAAQLLARLAQLYTDHPDYDPAWALETTEA